MTNVLHYGDNLHVLREHIADESVDLIYLDPPFNSNANYNILFKSPEGQDSDAQIEAFEDTWHWTDEAEAAFDDVMKSGNTKAFDLLNAMRSFLGENDMMAYLAMMAVRLIELHRVLKPTGSLYLHCDPTASHYLKLLLDGVFGAANYKAEIIWGRTNARGTSGKWPRIHDIILQYQKSDKAKFMAQKAPSLKAKAPHTLIRRDDGQKYNTFELTGAGVTKDGESGEPWRGFDPTPLGRHWGYNQKQLEKWADDDLIHFPKGGGFPRKFDDKPFALESRMVTVGDVWVDIDRLNQKSAERLGYPTQKPVALLERIIAASSNEGDVVLDPFCGCGTAVHAAEKLRRKWIGMDVTHLAISLIEKRMKEAFAGIEFEIRGRPNTLAAAQKLAHDNKNEFEKWAVTALDGIPYKTGQGADGGVDGLIYFNGHDGVTQKVIAEKAIISVKGGATKGVGMVSELVETIGRQKAAIGILLMAALPTREMEKRAAAAGFYDLGEYGRYPKIQIITLAELFQGKQPRLPNIDRSSFKKAKQEDKQQGKLL
ncbi:MAG: site-specific DNA-methyltransferase [Sphingomonadales bacterium]|nr:site-specific DNA-methyltransferase [Sphingomonadales bacterium]NCO47635.1 site-specific DNA-methyltransferase [Sphingomonadales bacterium]NCP00333.1 site-specific DNA-methyltransferase [Sphingomonadales bacterium]NCP26825.1 site-specific DNA-methyltransferase [Sphingomonadales bacterium]NCP44515.1 site-specific DNA-methyltransferase [Sphingomonadales bacterium]